MTGPSSVDGTQAFELAIREQLEGKDAGATLAKALEQRTAAFGPASPEACEVLLTLASEHARRGRPEGAVAALEELIRRAPAGTDAHRRALAMAGAFHSSFKQWEQAEGYLTRALDGATGPGRNELLHALGRTKLEVGQLAEGSALLEQAVAAGFAPAAIDLADLLAAQGDLAQARTVLEQGTRSTDKRWSIECTSRLAALLRVSGQPEQAEKHAREVVMAAEELDPQRSAVLALFELAAVQAQLGKNTEALRMLQRALEAVEKTEPRDDYAWAQAQLRLGSQLLYGFTGREADALPYLNRALGALTRLASAESPECAEVLVHVAVAMMRKGDVATAQGVASRAAALYERAYGPGSPMGKPAVDLAAALKQVPR